MKIALVHYWLVGMRGGEKVLEALCELFPAADIFTHVYREDRISETIRRHRIRTTFIANLPFSRTLYQTYLPWMPLALEQLDLRAYDLVISSESGPAKGVITPTDALHVCYCHTPMRYAWSGYHSYRDRSNLMSRWLMPRVMHELRVWDLASAARVDHFIANSFNVAERIRKYYRRDACVIYPPVNGVKFLSTKHPEDFYLFVGQLVAYKGADVAIEAFNRMGKRLVIVGRGERFRQLKKMCGPTVEMVGWQDDAALERYYARCKALVFTAEEDFGIVPVEAMSAGRPVIAYGRGGALETVIPGETGIHFEEQTPESLMAAVRRFESISDRFNGDRITRHAANFSKAAFKERIVETVSRWHEEHQRARRRASARRWAGDMPDAAD